MTSEPELKGLFGLTRQATWRITAVICLGLAVACVGSALHDYALGEGAVIQSLLGLLLGGSGAYMWRKSADRHSLR